jgi:hypothetical protein
MTLYDPQGQLQMRVEIAGYFQFSWSIDNGTFNESDLVAVIKEHPMNDGKYFFQSHALRKTSGMCNINFDNRKTRPCEDRMDFHFPYHFGRWEII